MNRNFLVITALFISLITLEVNAAKWRECNGNKIKWGSNTVTMRASNVSFAPGSSFTSSLQTTISRVNDNPSSPDTRRPESLPGPAIVQVFL